MRPLPLPKSLMEPAIRTVVDGEASESDEEEEVDEIPDVRQSDQNLVNAVSISGEALESDDEGETDPPIPALRVEHRDSGTGQEETGSHSVTRLYSSKPKYDSLLHKKLREKNASLRRHLVDSVHQMYLVSAKDLHNTSLQLHKSKALIGDLSHNMRNLTNDLFHLEDRVDIITSCMILPDINISVSGTSVSQ
ncbi:biogenesis of lysosome-related organelles complex 1 subunit 3-like [Crassostrea angulata]|uniref:biogenesis of lysosome-related organelles complex 1 subunit 3-like n=1 Tax=Magallana angulata TaxID=2784310 RepID=UPI0022B19FEC|nr:biogenesis of lysosome-related organelles complex 1 subunit 3-like [Crassostrea angulata]